MQDRGVTLNNHTLHHPYLPGLSYAEQKREICGMQDVIEKRYGERPTLFRPPYGNYNRDTLRAAKAWHRYAPIWNEEVFADHWDYREWDRKIHPGHRPHPLPGRGRLGAAPCATWSASSSTRSPPRDTPWPGWRTTCEARAVPAGRGRPGSRTAHRLRPVRRPRAAAGGR